MYKDTTMKSINQLVYLYRSSTAGLKHAYTTTITQLHNYIESLIVRQCVWKDILPSV